MRLSGVAVTISSRCAATGNQACGLAAATSVIGAMTATQRGSMLVEPAAQMRPPGVVEEGERQVGLEHRVADLRRVEVHVHREGPLLRRLVRPLRPLARLLEAADGGQCLRAGDQREVEVARPDLPRHLGGQHVGHRPADARVAPPRRAPRPGARPGGPRRRRTATTASRRRRCSRARPATPASPRRRRPPRPGPPAPTCPAARARARWRRRRRRGARCGGRRR